jgi:hypothetical protein
MTAQAKYALRFMFDAGSGRCLWSRNDPARERWGYAVDHRALPLDADLAGALDELVARHDTSLDWSDPGGPSPWTAAQHHAFHRDAQAVLAQLRTRLFAQFTIEDGTQPPEPPGL